MIPKQIINNINYIMISFDFLTKRKFKRSNELLKKISSFFYVNNNYIFIGRARTGIYLAVKIFLKKDRPKILMSPFTIPDVINMVYCAGGVPVFFDFKENTTFVDLKGLQQALKKNEFSALILTHYNINEDNYKKIYDICKFNDIKLIEDCAISVGGSAGNVRVGKLSDATVYSFSSFKYVNFFYGGLIFFKNFNYFQLAKKITKDWKKISFYQYLPAIFNTIKFQIITSKFLYTLICNIFYKTKIFQKKNIIYSHKKMNLSYFTLPSDPFFFEIDRKILNFKKLQNHRRKISSIYFKYLKHISIPADLTEKQICASSCFNYLIVVKNRNLLRKKLASMGLDTGYAMYPNCHHEKEYSKIEGSSKNVDLLVRNSIILPTHHLVTENYAKKIAKAILSNYL